jgi:hypothetical protein
MLDNVGTMASVQGVVDIGFCNLQKLIYKI